MSPFAFHAAGWLYVLAAAMLWLFRLHIFGFLLAVMAGAALIFHLNAARMLAPGIAALRAGSGGAG